MFPSAKTSVGKPSGNQIESIGGILRVPWKLCTEVKNILVYSLKNFSGSVVRSGAQRGNSAKSDGLSYEDDYRGNALAGLIVSGKPEIRFHSAFSEERVRELWCQFLAAPERAGLPLGRPTYQGRAI